MANKQINIFILFWNMSEKNFISMIPLYMNYFKFFLNSEKSKNFFRCAAMGIYTFLVGFKLV